LTFKSDGYLVIRGLWNNTSLKTLYEYTLQNYINGNFKDEQVLNTPSFYNDKLMVKLHEQLLPRIEKISGLKLFKTYCYYRTYKKGDILKSHTDRDACEISISLNLGGKKWDIWIMNYNEEVKQVYLKPGDALLYRGCDLKHWRGKNINSDDYSQVFLHYVDKDGPNSWAKNDLYRVKPIQN